MYEKFLRRINRTRCVQQLFLFEEDFNIYTIGWIETAMGI